MDKENSNRSDVIDKLEIGSGQKPSEGYLHQDVTEQKDVKLDFTCNPWEIPLAENSLSEAIALGVMEHIRYQDFDRTLIHIKKMLKPGGKFLFDVPDMKVWSEYLYNLTHGEGDKNPFSEEHVWATIFGWQRWPGDEHKCGWTKEKLVDHLKKMGFGVKEGVEVFTSKGIQRGRFTRPGDAHIYIEATNGF
jgi:predicted SAM-dependent methyltransferase